VNETGCDVLVVGGGVAGALAAAAAGRAGARTVLVEKETYLGGTGYAALLQHVCGLYLNGADTPSETLNAGLVREVAAALQKVTPGPAIQRMGRVFVLPYDRAGMMSVLESLLSGNPATVMRGTQAVGIERRGDEIRHVTVENHGARTTLSPSVVIDASGSGETGVMAGGSFELAPLQERQFAGYTIHIGGLTNTDDIMAVKVPYVLAKAVIDGKLPRAAQFTTFSFGRSPEEGFCKMSIGDEEGPDRDRMAARLAEAILGTLKKALPAFSHARIDDASLRVTDREGRRLLGGYVLTRDDVLQARKFPDGIVKNAWPVELWSRDRGTVYEYVPSGDYYEIPFRCLTVQGISNMLSAGRCISATREALGSTRVMGACMALGEQAGRAAAYRAKYGAWPIHIQEG
jgi:glycine/D-amino acid oxidase-like deaminating enzyme